MNIEVITAITGEHRELLIDDQPIDENVIYTAYTEQNSKFWNIKPPYQEFKDQKANAKIHKILSHKYSEANITLWIDGTIQLLIPPSEIINEFLTDEVDMIILENDSLDFSNVFNQGEFILNNKLCNHAKVIPQLNKYSKLNFPNVMTNNKFIIRRNNEKINEFNDAWWAEICKYSFRDQLSLSYLIDKYKINFKLLPVSEHSKYFNFFNHSKIKYN